MNAPGDDADLNADLAQLANARYAPESDPNDATASRGRRTTESLIVFTTLVEARQAVNRAATAAQRLMSIYTPDLEPDLYDQTAFLEIVKHFVLARSFSKVRVLLVEPTRVMRDSNRFVAMGRRLSSCIDIRYVAAQSPQRASAYLIADDRAIAYRMRADTWEGIADFNNPPVAKLYLTEFDTVWNASAAEHGLRVAAVTENAGQFLVVEERINHRLVFNQPAGHVENGETIIEALVREVREETAWVFLPDAFLGVYLWRSPASGRATLRFAFCGAVADHDASQPLDRGIVRTHWLTRTQLIERKPRLRSPLVLRCIDDYLSGRRLPLDAAASLDLNSAAEVTAIRL